MGELLLTQKIKSEIGKQKSRHDERLLHYIKGCYF